jgi:hypothetical protein
MKVYLIIALYSFLKIRMLDFLIKLFFKESTSYFLLHSIFNFWVTWVVLDDVIFTLLNPFKIYQTALFSESGLLSTIGIVCFHLNHILFYSNLSKEDWLHHIISSVLVPIIAFIFPFSHILSLSNIVMCGIPGGIDYFMLFLVKLNFLDKLTEKRINRFLNLLIRWPFMFLCFYIFTVNVIRLNIKSNYLYLMFFGFCLHLTNAIYYCDKVIGNYYLTCNKNLK